jgi:rhamnose utilization protein RhaD (predicted bifunctional aldolase and dehydrogenase)/NAD(P)-dependent dehydrogenase (short-subunit alcohol dehydrogenase family)
MNSLWDQQEAAAYTNDPLATRVYTSRLLGREPSLVLSGGGNTSVKADAVNLFGEREELLYVKGSGWDLANIEKSGFAPVKMDVLLRMARLEQLSDTQMVRVQRSAMTDPGAPNPSVEAVLHAVIPFVYVDHTHADAVVAITNTEEGEARVRDIYGGRVLVIPYVMPGFILAQKVYAMTRSLNWKNYDVMVLMSHGVFTFHDDAKACYERMIKVVSQAENYLQKKGVSMFDGTPRPPQEIQPGEKREHLLNVARLRRAVSRQKGGPVLAGVNISERSLRFSSRQDVASVATRGPLTPDHVIRTKRVPLIIGDNIEKDLDGFAGEYRAYFDRHARGALTCLDPAPRWAVWPGRGTVTFGSTVEETDIISDIVDHTLWAMEAAETLGGWKALPEKDIFDVEYWELEQAKLKKGGRPLVFQGKVALVTGAAGGIGRACVEALRARGAAVAALDINPRVGHDFSRASVLGLVCDVTDEEDIRRALETLVGRWGGLDILVSNAGIFPAGELIADVKPDTWQRSLDINLTGHQRLLRQCIPYLSLGIDPAVVVVASKNVSAPGPGASAYSVAKAGLTQLARVAALELAPQGVRVNVVHPNQVFDTAIWTPEVLANRAGHYGMSVEEYKTNNLLKTEIKSSDVAELVCAMAGPVFGKTTGAQVPIDGGNDRVI